MKLLLLDFRLARYATAAKHRDIYSAESTPTRNGIDCIFPDTKSCANAEPASKFASIINLSALPRLFTLVISRNYLIFPGNQSKEYGKLLEPCEGSKTFARFSTPDTVPETFRQVRCPSQLPANFLKIVDKLSVGNLAGHHRFSKFIFGEKNLLYNMSAWVLLM